MDIKKICLSSAASPLNSKSLIISLLNRKFVVTYPEVRISYLEDDSIEPGDVERTLLLHYLEKSEDLKLSGRLIPFRKLPGAISYERAFTSRALAPIIRQYEKDISGFKKAAGRLDAKKSEYGDISFIIPALPRIPLIYVLWAGDEELPGQANILFDSTASRHLPTEDLAVLSELTTERLIAFPRNLGDKPG